MNSEPDIVRILRQEEKDGKLKSNFSINTEDLKQFNNLDIYTSKNDYKIFSDLMEIINFTEKLSTSLHGDLNCEEIIEIVINANAFFLRSESVGLCMGSNRFITSPMIQCPHENP